MVIPIEARFLQHVEKTETCWLWTGQRLGEGGRYGGFRVGTKATDLKRYAHRVAWELWVGPIPEGLEIDHVKARGCSSTLCVRPAHLEPVTPAENRRRQRLRVCHSGQHDLTDDADVVFDSQGRRRGCRQCRLARQRESYHRGKGRA